MAEQTGFERITNITRRGFLATVTAAGLSRMAKAQVKPSGDTIVRTDFSKVPPYGNGTLPAGIRSRHIANVNGVTVHILEAGFETPGRPAVLLLHGFPELAYSWRKVMPPLAAAGYHVIAPDLRGYGRTGGTDVKFDDDLSPFRTLNRVLDMTALVSAFGYRSLAAIVGHDVGSGVAAWSSIVRPDIFRATVLMSAP